MGNKKEERGFAKGSGCFRETEVYTDRSFSLLTSSSTITARPLSDIPSFPELVVYLLPEKEWLYLVEAKITPAKTRRPGRGSRLERLEAYHYNLLQLEPGCNKSKLESAYKAWRKLEEYENGEEIAKSLLETVAPFGVTWNLFMEINKGLSMKDEAWRKKWIETGLAEAGRTKK